ncbi:MAG: class I SAM-dependent methyltransferase [Actinomycetota bacterium]
MDLAAAARTINATGYAYISSWALLTACELRLFDRLPARADELGDVSPDADLVTTLMYVLSDAGLVVESAGTWSQDDGMARLLTGDASYADYLGGQVLQQMTPRLTLGPTGRNVLADVLAAPDTRTGYAGWFADAEEARAYQASQFAGSLGPAKGLARTLPAVAGPVLDVGGGWGAMARAVASHHEVDVDVVDLPNVVVAAPPVGDRVRFVAGDALDPASWPTDRDESYDGAILSYLFSSIPGDRHGPLLDALAEHGVRWVAVHDFLVDGGAHAAAWSLQHAVFVPGHRSRRVAEVEEMLAQRGWATSSTSPLVDEMTTLVVGRRG